MSKSSTKALVPPPPRKNRLGVAPTIAPAHMKEGKLKDMSFKVDPSFHARYKMAAAAAGLQMKDILEESFELWVKEHTPES